MKPICVPCQRFFRPKRNAFKFIEGMPIDNAQPGTAEPEKWRPYKLWSGDKWECQGCGAQIVVGTGREPIDEHFTSTFAKNVETYKPELQVNDC